MPFLALTIIYRHTYTN